MANEQDDQGSNSLGWQCRVDGRAFLSQAACHHHVDNEHSNWGYSVCAPYTAITCKECGESFDGLEAAEAHVSDAHDAADAQGSLEFAVADD